MVVKKESILFKILKSINIYGMPFSIKYKNNTTYISILGILLSLITIIIISILLLYYFLELIKHSTFTVLNNNDKNKEISINLSNIPIMLGLININATLLEINKEYLSISIFKRTLIPINKSDGHLTLKRLELEYCNESIYKNEYPEMKKYDLSKLLCIKPNQSLEIKGRYGDSINGFKTIDIFLNICEECLNKTNNLKELENYSYDSYFSIHYLSNIIDHYNYKEPLIQNFRSENFEINPLIHKKFLYYFSSLSYISDNGYLFNVQKKYNSLIFDYLNFDFIERNNSMIYDNKIYSSIIQIIFSCSEYRITYNRTYLKITDIFSKIGGLIDFIFIVFNTINSYFSKKNFVVDIANNLICNKCISACTKYHNNGIYNISKFTNKDTIHNKSDFRNSENQKFPLNLTSFKSNFNDKMKKNTNKKYLTSNNLDFNDSYLKNSKLKQFLKTNIYNLGPQKLNITIFEYVIPYCFLQKFKKYNLLYIYKKLINSYLSLEEILPSIERISRLYREDKNNQLLSKTKYNNVFSYK